MIICLTETHDAADTICPTGYVVAARRDRTKYGGGTIVFTQDCMVFDEINTLSFCVARVTELVAISCNGIIFICCYRQPLATDTTLFKSLDSLLNQNTPLSPVICGDFNVHESVWLQSSHTSSAGTTMLDFCDSRGLHQLITFPTHQNAILDLVISKHTETTQVLLHLIMLPS